VPASVYINRLIVEEGFLDGLDISFSPGLNVIIGARGVGKTSIVQLLRFCLGVPAFGESFETSAMSHAQDVLGADGRVSVGLMVDGEPLVVSRRKQDDRPEGQILPVAQPIILAQTEMEEIAVDPRGRLRLLDDFRPDRGAATNRERALASTAESLTIEMAELAQSIDSARREAESLETEKAALEVAEAELASTASETTDVTNIDLARLDVLGREAASARVGLTGLDQAAETLARWVEALKATPRAVPAIEMSPGDGEDPLISAREAIREVEASLEAAAVKIAGIQEDIAARSTEAAAHISALDDEARDIRRRVEEVEKGAGLAARRLAALRERVAQLTALIALIGEREATLRGIRESRDEAVTSLDEIRSSRFHERLQFAKRLTSSLGPQIQISVQQSGDWSDYAAAIADAVRGSGLHYASLAPKLAEGLSPAELARAVDLDDAKAVAKAAGVPPDRARRVIDRIKERGLGQLLTAPLQDAVELELLDGSEYKRTEQLSTGQRCTTVLPILLQHEDRPVILDQPEDHLDGAFIVDTLVQAILRRDPASQLIASTHNPNIPVLGDASQVTLLGSDGQRGFQVHSGALTDPDTVKAITSVMEGGQEAFERRARFYGAKEG
jgi:AAA domain